MTGITKSYAGRRVLDGITLDVQAGAIVALLGPNGSGKSTLLRIAANLSLPDAGTVEVLGAAAKHDAYQARRHVAYVGQDPALYDELTPAEHVAFGTRLRPAPTPTTTPTPKPTSTSTSTATSTATLTPVPAGISSSAHASSRKEVDARLAQAGLAAAAHKPTGTLSRGQRQRLALALAAIGAPRIWILDEPFTALDAQGQGELEARLLAQRATGTAILVALHDEAQARRLADHIVRLSHHRLAPDDAPAHGASHEPVAQAPTHSGGRP